jgi:hypothetical protein
MPPRVLTIVIPALDEQDAIGSTVQRCLDARSHIIASSSVEAVEVIVVNDGSSDRTEEIAAGFPEVTVLGYDENRGYGAAIKSGFEVGRGELLAFLDADGTCEPRFLADLCRGLDEQRADVALGSRMGPASEMPWLRSVGNLVFAWMLGVLSKQRVRDTASGMRVLRRDCLEQLYPLPDGLHFTPAMSARVLLEEKLRLVEIPMPYAERVGRSKLRVLRDGMRFVGAIVHAAMRYRPARPLLLTAGLLALVALAVVFMPLGFWLRFGRLEEWMIYRILLGSLLTTVVALLVSSAVVADRIAAIAHRRPAAVNGLTAWLSRFFTRRARRFELLLLCGAAVALVWPGLVEYTTTRQVEMHWSRAALASLLLVIAAALGTTSFLLNTIELIAAHQRAAPQARQPDRIRPGISV